MMKRIKHALVSCLVLVVLVCLPVSADTGDTSPPPEATTTSVNGNNADFEFPGGMYIAQSSTSGTANGTPLGGLFSDFGLSTDVEDAVLSGGPNVFGFENMEQNINTNSFTGDLFNMGQLGSFSSSLPNNESVTPFSMSDVGSTTTPGGVGTPVVLGFNPFNNTPNENEANQ